MAQHLRPSKQPKPLTTKEKWAYWLNSWRWSEIKKTWTTEYSRVHGNTTGRMNKINDKFR